MINWKVRLRHPAFITAVFSLVGYILVDSSVIDAGKWETYVELVFGILVTAGIVVDPTTTNVADSKQALKYDKPRKW